MVATAESCTGGLIVGALTEVSGSSSVVDRGFVTYSNDAKIQMLGVDTATLAAHGAVSRQTAAGDGTRRSFPFAGRYRCRRNRHCRPERRHRTKNRSGSCIWQPQAVAAPYFIAKCTMAISAAMPSGSQRCARRSTCWRMRRRAEPISVDSTKRWSLPLCCRVNRVGALLEGLGKHPESPVEHRAHQGTENAALEFVVDEKVDRTTARARVFETPAIVEIFERAIDIFDVDDACCLVKSTCVVKVSRIAL